MNTLSLQAGPAGGRPVAGPTRVVIADDSQEVRELVRLVLETEGAIAVVGEAADGAEAVAVVDAIRPDAVLLDLAMPVMDGLDALREIRSRCGDEVTVVVWSGFSATHVAGRALELGASAYVEKSGDLRAVVAALESAGWGAPPEPSAPSAAAAGGVELPPEPEVGRFRMQSPLLLIALATVLFAGIFAWRAADPNPGDRLTELYVLPVLVLAVQYGIKGGIGAAAVATGLFVAYSAARGLVGVGYFSALASYLVAGATVGWYSEQTHRIARLRERDRTAVAAANRRLASAAAASRSVNAALADTNADLRQFMHVAGHDLAEPLRTMSGFAEMVRSRYQDSLDDRGRQFLDHIVDGAARMQALIDDLMAYTRASQQDLHHDDVDLEAVVEGVVAALAARIHERGAVVSVPAPLPHATGDASMLGLVIQNLVSNAIKFNDSPTPRVEITAVLDGPTLRVAVADDGIGIPPGYQERIFSLFQRLHTRSECPGTGLGLAICRRIVDRHGGAISVTSAPGRGTTFVVDLPAGGGR